MTLSLVVDLIIVGLLVCFIVYAIILNIRLRRFQKAIREMVPAFDDLRQMMAEHETKTRAMLESLERHSKGALDDDGSDITPSSFYSLAKKDGK